MKDVKWVDNLSFKVSYGEQGNDDILTSSGTSNYYLWQSLYALGWNNGNNIGAVVSTLETKDVTWEKNKNLNIGLEGALFDNLIRFSVQGGRLIGVENGDMTDLGSVKASERKAFSGLCLGIVAADKKGPVTVTVTSDGLAPSTITFQAE